MWKWMGHNFFMISCYSRFSSIRGEVLPYLVNQQFSKKSLRHCGDDVNTTAKSTETPNPKGVSFDGKPWNMAILPFVFGGHIHKGRPLKVWNFLFPSPLTPSDVIVTKKVALLCPLWATNPPSPIPGTSFLDGHLNHSICRYLNRIDKMKKTQQST